MKLVDRRLVIPTRAIRESSASTACEVRNEDAGLPTQTLGNDEIWAGRESSAGTACGAHQIAMALREMSKLDCRSIHSRMTK